MAKEPIHVDVTVHQTAGGEAKGLFIVTAGRVDISMPDPIVGHLSRQEAKNLAETLLRALQETA